MFLPDVGLDLDQSIEDGWFGGEGQILSKGLKNHVFSLQPSQSRTQPPLPLIPCFPSSCASPAHLVVLFFQMKHVLLVLLQLNSSQSKPLTGLYTTVPSTQQSLFPCRKVFILAAVRSDKWNQNMSPGNPTHQDGGDTCVCPYGFIGMLTSSIESIGQGFPMNM